jgi:HK97 family phage major capsid protein/HK97 family phage prohead protease
MKRDLPEAEAMQRAYSILHVKQIEHQARRISGIATTPEVDRVGDIVEPKGVSYKNPLPLLWMHDSHKPVGFARFGKPTADGIPFEAEIARIDEPGLLKERLDEAWQSVKLGLVGAVSIGFRVMNDAVEHMKGGGLRFLETEVMELSLVVIPANASATIQTIKSIDQQSLSAALRAKKAKPVSLSSPQLGDTGAHLEGNAMKTFKEQIAAFEARRAANAAELTGIMAKSGEAGSTLEDEAKQKFDALNAENSEIDEHLGRLKIADSVNVQKAAAIAPSVGTDPVHAAKARVPALSAVRVEANIEKGVRFVRMGWAMARAKYLQKIGQFQSPEDIYKSDRRWMDTAPEVYTVLKSAVAGGDSTTSGWASEWAYAQNIASEFIEVLRPQTLLGKIQGWRRVPFNIRVGGASSGTTGYWVGEGAGINVSKMVSTSTTLGITKVAGLSVVTKELAMLSDPSAELMVRDDLIKECQETADFALIDPNNGGSTNVKPQSLTYGATPRLASGTDYAAFKADFKALTANFYAANISLNGAVFIMKEELAEALALMVTSLGNPQFPGLSATGGTLMGRPVFTTQVADTTGSPDFDNLLILLQPNQVFLADDGTARVEASDQVAVHMDDATTMSAKATATSTSVVSMWQTDSIAIKAVRHVNWTKARSQACQYIRGAAYV